MNEWVLDFDQVGLDDVEQVGGKNASLGEMIQHLSQAGVSVPGGFATTAKAFHAYLDHNQLTQRIHDALSSLDVNDTHTLTETGAKIRQWVHAGEFPPEFLSALEAAYQGLTQREGKDVSFAVRSSATAEDLPEASFAGQQETFLNIRGLDGLFEAIKQVFASLYNDRAIAYRVHQGFAHSQVALSAGIQRMVRSDLAASGVMFTLDTESGFDQVVFITGSWGLGEMVVQGAVNPDEFVVHKIMLEAGRPAILQRHLGAKQQRMLFADASHPGNSTVIEPTPPEQRQRFCLTDEQIRELAHQAVIIEKHYGRPMDIEWALDGLDNKLYIVQARPETVQSRPQTQRERYVLNQRGPVICEGRSIGQRIGKGPARVIASAANMHDVQDGDVLVTDMTDPDWEPVMKRAAAIVTNRGGRTCHAAIIARELGIPAVVGADGATEAVPQGQDVTVSCAEGDIGYVYEGLLDFAIERTDLSTLPELPFKIMLNVGNPEMAFGFSGLPNAGVGLARMEFIIARTIGIHPKALLNLSDQDDSTRATINKLSAGYDDPISFYREKIVEGISTLGAAFWPKPVIVRLSDFKSNEYANLIGGKAYEPEEENPMLGFRGASRYLSADFADCFALECQAMKEVRDELGYTNIELMIPFVRTVEEAKSVIKLLEQNGLRRGDNGLRVIMMCEIPSNALQAEAFLEHFDGFSIGSNDLTQLTLGLDRDSGLVADRFDERDPAVKILLQRAIEACNQAGKYIGICGQGPSDHPDLAYWLMEQGIDSVSLNPDSVIETWLYLGDPANKA